MTKDDGCQEDQARNGQETNIVLDKASIDPSNLSNDELETLKHRLAGPSVNKPGQDSVDQRKVRLPQTVVS